MFKNILFVCVGNICRSPAAEFWARAKLLNAGYSDTTIFSRGLHAMTSHAIAPEMQAILSRFEIDASAHVSCQVKIEDVSRADIIFTMETWQQQELSLVFPSGRGKIFCLGKWRNEEILDPYRQAQSAFEETFQLIQENWKIWQDKLWNG